MAGYLLDTNICVAVIKDRHPDLRRKFNEHQDDLAISTITLHELFYGAAKSDRPERSRRKIKEFIGRLDLITFDPQSADSAGDIRGDLAKAGTPIGPYDIMIAGTARAHGMTLVTHNTREFARVAGLKIEDWIEG